MKPLVSIVTVTFNAELTLEKTILSVINQNFISFEYIIIDGGSHDNTINIIDKYKNKISYWESSPDKGIYDAMNKAINFVNGRWVCFMNAGDVFFNHNVLSEIFNLKNINHYWIIYGNHSFIKENHIIFKIPKDIKSIWKSMPMCHQSLFAKTILLKSYPFNIKYKFAADYDFIYYAYKNYSNSFLYINKVISTITTGGYSETNSVKTYKEYKLISNFYNKNFYNKIYFYLKLLERMLVLNIKNFIKNFKS